MKKPKPQWAGARRKHQVEGGIFGLLSVIEDLGEFVACQCSCGKLKTVRRFDLTSRKTRSCGCLRASNGGRPRWKFPEDLMKVDWSQPNMDIARRHGVSRQQVSIYRLRLEAEGKISVALRDPVVVQRGEIK